MAAAQHAAVLLWVAMPRLLTLLACERVLLDTEENSISAISIIHDLKLNVPEAPPKDAVAPLNWAVISIWSRTDNERKPIEIRTRLLLPSGTQAFVNDGEQTFDNFTKTYQRVITRIPAFPVGEQGEISVVVSVREKGQPEFSDVASYKIHFSYEVQKDLRGAATAQLQEDLLSNNSHRG